MAKKRKVVEPKRLFRAVISYEKLIGETATHIKMEVLFRARDNDEAVTLCANEALKHNPKYHLDIKDISAIKLLTKI